MNKILLSILALSIASNAYAQPAAIYQDPAAPVVLYSEAGQRGPLAVDEYGYIVQSGGTGNVQSVIPVSNAVNLNGQLNSVNGYFNVSTDTIEAASTTTVLNLTAHVARVGDIIVPTGGTAANIDVEIPVCSVATNSVTLCNALPATPSTDAITIRRPKPLFTPKEDSVAVDGEVGLSGLSVRSNGVTVNAAQGDYQWNTSGSYGNQYNTWLHDVGVTSTNVQVSKLEDAGAASGDAGVVIFSVAETALTGTVGNSGDYGVIKTDGLGRTITTLAPAGESWQSCSAATAGSTSDIAIKAAVASNRIYVTAITCSNSSSVPTVLNFRDGATRVANGNITANAVGGSYHATFPVPLRGTSNTAFNFNADSAVTSVVCCASGYISVN